jgi:hypothetical protein
MDHGADEISVQTGGYYDPETGDPVATYKRMKTGAEVTILKANGVPQLTPETQGTVQKFYKTYWEVLATVGGIENCRLMIRPHDIEGVKYCGCDDCDRDRKNGIWPEGTFKK